MAALPLIQKVEQSLATRVGNAVSAFMAPTDQASSGQNVPSTSANSTQPASAPALSASMTGALLNAQNSVSSIHGHHHGAGRYRTAQSSSDQADSIPAASGSGSSVSASITV
jgi:hypothetical protein